MAVDPSLFRFYAPTPQPVDYSAMQRAAEFTAQAYMQSGEAISRGLGKASEALSQGLEKSERAQSVKSFQNEIQNEDNYDTKTYRLADTMFGDVLSEVEVDLADFQKSGTSSDWIAQNRASYERKAIIGKLMQNGYTELQASQVADQSLTPMQARIMKPGVAPRLRAMGAGLVAQGIMSSDAITQTIGTDTYQNEQEFFVAKNQLASALGRPQELTEIARINEQLRAYAVQQETATKSEVERAKLLDTVNRDYAKFAEDLKVASSKTLADYELQLGGRRNELEISLRKAVASNDTEEELRLLKERERIDTALQDTRIKAEKEMQSDRLKAEEKVAGTRAAAQMAKDLQWDKSEENVVRDVTQAYENQAAPFQAIPLTSLYGDDVQAAARVLLAELQSVGPIEQGVALSEESIKRASVRAVSTDRGGVAIDVDLPALNNDPKKAAIEAAIEDALNTKFRGNAGAIVGLTQATGSRQWTSDAAQNVLIGARARDPESFAMMNELLNRSLRANMSGKGKAVEDFYKEPQAAAPSGSPKSSAPAKPSLGGASPRKATTSQ